MNLDRMDLRSSVLPLEFKFSSAKTTAGSIRGYANVFNIVDKNADMVVPGAFRDAERDARAGRYPLMLSQHGGMGLDSESLTPIGIWTRLEEDSRGLSVDGTLADTPRGREIWTLLNMKPRPAIDGLSIGYRVKDFSMGTRPGEPRRTIKRIELIEISVVSMPANEPSRFAPLVAEGSGVAAAADNLRTAFANLSTIVDRVYAEAASSRLADDTVRDLIARLGRVAQRAFRS